jgi:ABC-type bacteriocin/lantibiotic exporter with double-glycine peptidase domain
MSQEEPVPPSRPLPTGDLVLDVVEALAPLAGVPVERGVVRAAMRDEGEGAGTVLERITRVAGRVGIRVQLQRGRAAIWKDTPAVVLFGMRWSAVAPDARPAAIAASVGAEADDELTFLVAAPSAPLTALASDHGEHRSPLSRFWSLVQMERRDLLLVLVYASGYGLMSLAVPVAVETLVGTVAFGSLMQPIVTLMILLAAALTFAALMRGYQFYVVELIQRRIFARAAVDVAHRMPRVSIERFEHGSPAELVNRFFDAIAVQKSAGMLLVDGITILLEALLGMMLLAFYHPFLAAFDAFLVLAILFVLFVLGRGGPKAFVETSKAKYEVAAWLEEIAHHPVAFKSAGWTGYATERATDVVRRYLARRGLRFRVVLRQIIGTYTLQVFANTTLLGIGGYLVIQRQLTIGQLVASNLIVAAVVEGFTKFGKQIEAFYDLLAGLDKLGHLTDVPLERDGGAAAPERTGAARVEVRGLGYSVEGQDVLRDVNLDLAPGTRALVVGPEGAGKSVLAELLFGLRAPSAGVVRVDEADLRTLSLESLRGVVALARDVEIFDGTVAENVSGGTCDAEATRAAIAAVGLAADVEALPEGLSTRLSDRRGPLSSGQRRRLALARTIANRPRVLVVDETLDGLDEDQRARVVDALVEPAAPWTLLVLAKDDRLANRFDRVFRLEGGLLAEVNR